MPASSPAEAATGDDGIYIDSLLRSCRHDSPTVSVVTRHCVSLAVLFVGGLYLVPPRIRRMPRNDARQIRWRILSVLVTVVVATAVYPLAFCGGVGVDDDHDVTVKAEGGAENSPSALRYMGWSWETRRDLAALLHVMALYSGPMAACLARIHVARTHVVGEYSCAPRRKPRSPAQQQQQHQPTTAGEGSEDLGAAMQRRRRCKEERETGDPPHDIGPLGALNEMLLRPAVSFVRRADVSERWGKLRDLVVAPAAEEIVFRGCMVYPLLSAGVRPSRAAWIAPLFFGAAHLHHAAARLGEGVPPGRVALGTAFQFAYTSLFGAYAAHALIRTGSVPAVVLCHAFCNCMGLPDLGFWQRTGSPLSCAHRYRYVIAGAYAAGIAVFALGFSSPAENGDGWWLRWPCFFPATSVLPSL